MLNFYIFAAIIGAGLVIVSAFMGHGHDTDMHSDLSVDHGDVDVHADHDGSSASDSWIPFLSLRFWTYFLAAFGLVGLGLTFFAKELTEPTVGIFSAVGGLVTGLAVAFMMRMSRRFEAGSSLSEEDLLGREASVTVAIRPNGMGKVKLNVRGELLELTAIPQDTGDTLEPGVGVVIVAMESEKAVVMPRKALFE